jgi:hypothetical protein
MPQDVEALWATRSKAEEMQREQKAAWQQRAARAETLSNQVCVTDWVFSAPSMILFPATAAPSSGRQVTVEDRLFGECVVLGRVSEDWLSKSPRL